MGKAGCQNVSEIGSGEEKTVSTDELEDIKKDKIRFFSARMGPLSGIIERGGEVARWENSF